ncbi:hypothetical protein SFUMM280S_03077 [Streptomyces fumanus]
MLSGISTRASPGWRREGFGPVALDDERSPPRAVHVRTVVLAALAVAVTVARQPGQLLACHCDPPGRQPRSSRTPDRTRAGRGASMRRRLCALSHNLPGSAYLPGSPYLPSAEAGPAGSAGLPVLPVPGAWRPRSPTACPPAERLMAARPAPAGPAVRAPPPPPRPAPATGPGPRARSRDEEHRRRVRAAERVQPDDEAKVGKGEGIGQTQTKVASAAVRVSNVATARATPTRPRYTADTGFGEGEAGQGAERAGLHRSLPVKRERERWSSGARSAP